LAVGGTHSEAAISDELESVGIPGRSPLNERTPNYGGDSQGAGSFPLGEKRVFP
jgi:hypothetical protein